MLHASRTVMPLWVALALFVSPIQVRAQTSTLDAGVADPAEVSAPANAAATPPPAPAPADGSAPAPVPAPVYPPAPYYPQPAPVEGSYGYAPGTTAYAPGPALTSGHSRFGAPGAREHDGFFLRLTVGAGAGFTRYREAVDGVQAETVRTGGVAGEFEVAVGGRLVGNLIAHGNLLVSRVGAANKTVSGVKDASTSPNETSLVLIGGGLTYYFMPQNVYVSTMLAIGGMGETRDNDQAFESRAGVGGALMLGKEWWLGLREEWGVGAALRGLLLNAPVTVGGVDSRMAGSQITIVFSATLN